MVTTERPSLEIDRTLSVFGTPITAVSMGYVTSCSTSVGGSPGHSVVITTWLFVRSGNASMGICEAMYPLMPMNARRAARVIQRWSSAKLMIRSSMRGLITLVLEKLALQQQRAIDDYGRAGLQAGQNLDLTIDSCAGLDLLRGEGAGRGLHEHNGFPADLLDRRFRDVDHRTLRLRGEFRRSKHIGLQQSSGVGDDHAHLKRPGLGIEPFAQLEHVPGEGLVRIRADRDANGLPAADVGEVRFIHCRDEPQRRKVGEGGHYVARVYH